MSTTTSSLVVKVGSDGIVPATLQLEGLAVASVKAEQGANKAKVAMAELSTQTTGLSKSASNAMMAQRKSIDLYGEGKEFAGAYSATLKGANQAQVALSASMGATIDMQKASAKAMKESELATENATRANKALAATLIENTELERLRVAAEKSQRASSATSLAEEVALAEQKGKLSVGGKSTTTVAGQNRNMTHTNDSDVASAKNAKAAEKAVVAAAEEAKAYETLTASLDPYGTKLIKIADNVELVTSAHRSGLSSVDTFNEEIKKLDSQKVGVLAAELKAAEKAAHLAGDGMNNFSMASGRAKSEIIVMIRELMRGDFTRLTSSVSVFAQATGMMGTMIGIVLNPITWLVAGITGLAVAANMGSNEFRDFNKTMITTGGYATLTANQFGAMSKSLGAIGGEGQHAAAAALNEIAASGTFTGVQLETVGRAAIQMQEATGKAVQETVKEFEKLSGDPVKASLELNDKYHYLTLAVFEQIKALEEQGRTSDAATVAINAMADAVANRTPDQLANIGFLEKAWHGVKWAIVGATNAAMSIGRDNTADQQIAALQAQIKENTKNSGGLFGGNDKATKIRNDDLQAQIELISKRTDRETGYAQAAELTAQATTKGIKAANEIGDQFTNLDKATKLQKALNVEKQRFIDLNNTPGKKSEDLAGVSFGTDKDGKTTVSGGKYDLLSADITEKIMGKGRAPRSNEYGISAALKEQQGLLQDARQNLAQDISENKNLYDIGEETQKDYLKKILDLKQDELSKELVIAAKQEELAGGKKNLTAQKAYDNEISAIYNKRVGALKEYNQAISKFDADDKSAAASYASKLDKSLATRQSTIDAAPITAGMGDRQKAQYDVLVKLRENFDKEMADLADKHENKNGARGSSDELYAAEKSKTKSDYAARIDQETKAYEQTSSIQGQWLVGADKAFANYQNTAADTASQSATVFTNAFSSMENALVSFATTGKISFGSLVASILTDIARMEAKAATSQLLGMLVNMAALSVQAGQSYGGAAGQAMDGANGFNLNSGFSTVASAKGNAFDGGALTAFADGGSFTNGVVDQPTNFNMGLMGEAGPEAIVPLTRTSDGSLGVKQIGGGSGGSGDTNVNNVINIHQSGGSSSQTSANDASATHQQFAVAISNATQAEIAKQMRQGGLLWKMKNNQTGT